MSGTDYRARGYRAGMGSRFSSFTVSYKETDLWIGVDPPSFSPDMEDFAATRARRLRLELEAYIARRPEFRSSLVPIYLDPEAPPIAAAMLEAGTKAGVGPMAAVAGAVSSFVGRAMAAEFRCRELIVENGGDLWLKFEDAIDASVFAGSSPLSDRVGLSIPREYSPLGLCTSSGTVGPSLSLGKADAAMIACRSRGGAPDAALADAWATRIGNAVAGEEDLERALDLAEGSPDILSVIVIKGDRMGIRGRLPLKLFAPG